MPNEGTQTTETTETTEPGNSNSNIEELKDTIASLRTESAKYRVQRNDALRANHAYSHIIKAHKINVDISKMDLSHLTIDNGTVSGEVEYKPEKINVPNQQTFVPDGTSTTLTLDDVKKMSPKEINDNWETISKLMKK